MRNVAPLSVIILTYNEEPNLPHSLESVVNWADQVFVVDSYSEDQTLDIAKNYGAPIFQNSWVDWATQRNWALDNLPIRNDWVLFLDADERVSDELAREISETLNVVPDAISGFYINRRYIFLGKELRHGGYNPNWVLRLVRRNRTRVLPAGDSEYFKVEGVLSRLKHNLLHEDKKDLSFFSEKHIRISQLAADKLLNGEKMACEEKERRHELEGKYRVWIREKVLNRLPLFSRPFLLFIYKYFFKLGFLDGKEGFVYYFIHYLWYPFLVDSRILEMRKKAR